MAALAALVRSPSVAEWWGTPGDRDDLLQDGDAFVVEVDGEVAGWLGFAEEAEPEYQHVGLDIVLAQQFQDRGLGSEALRTVIRWFAGERGHHRFTIDPAVANERAIRAYEAVGFRTVGVLRKYERGSDGEWHDGLLMDLLVEEIEL
jgi:aminoglycoside 6'-N-acetyltransferase